MRRANPENIYEAKRAGLRGRMVSSWHVAPDVADAALDGWGVEAKARGIPRDDLRYLAEGEAWLRDTCGVSDAV